jgi:hypothetical protein
MNATATDSPPYRSEAFCEDVLDLVSAAPQVVEPAAGPARWLVHAVPVAVALVGLAFAVVPPLN